MTLEKTYLTAKCLIDSGEITQEIFRDIMDCEIVAVVHAHWTDDEECSNCGCYKLFEKAADRYMFWRSTSAFCPSCGAIMDEEVDDE